MLFRLDAGPREHDYTQSMWGHALHSPELVEVAEPADSIWQRWFGRPIFRQEFRALGHGSVRENDTILVKMQSGKTARFVVREISYFRDPDDMFKINRADFIEYAASAGEAQRAETTKIDSVHEHAVGAAETPKGSRP